MAKTKSKAGQKQIAAKRKELKNRSKAVESVDCLIELHKLQAVLLNALKKEVLPKKNAD